MNGGYSEVAMGVVEAAGELAFFDGVVYNRAGLGRLCLEYDTKVVSKRRVHLRVRGIMSVCE